MTTSSIAKKVFIAAATTLAAMSLTTAASKAEGYIANYSAYVISVAPWDELNIRAWPAYYSQKVSEIPHDGQFVWVQRCVVKPNGSSSDWCKVNHNGNWGWVNKKFLAAH